MSETPRSIPESQDDPGQKLLRIAEAIDRRLEVDWDSEAAQSPGLWGTLEGLRNVERIAKAQTRVRLEAAASLEPDLVGSTLSHYRVIERIGSGGMGVVYRARDERLRRDVALKVLRADRLRDEVAQKHLLQEARVACSINHPNVAAIYDVGEGGGEIFFAMECVEGATLSDLIRNHPLPPRTVIDYGFQIASALEAAHEKGVIHRDLKSLNIRVTPSGRVKVLDFGLSIRTISDAHEVFPEESDWVASPAVAGTLPYLAPETIRGERPDARSDIWALGVTLFESITGHLPFRGRTREEVERAILHQDLEPIPPRVPIPVQRLLERCLRKEPERRYQRASEVRAALDAIRDSTSPRRSRVLALAVTAAGLAALLLAVGQRMVPVPPKAGLLAVLPVRNSSGAPDQQFLADGLTDQLINTFAQLSPIPIMSRTSAYALSRRVEPISKLAAEYNIALVLEASSMRVGNRVRVNAELFDARNDRPIWAESYERPIEEIMTLDREIARAVALRVKAPLTTSDRERLTAARPVNLAVYQDYVEGRSLAAERNYRGALEHYADATRRDSTFAAGYAGLVDCYLEMLYYGQIPPREGMARAASAAQRALELGATQASPHLALAFIHGIQWDWKRTDEELLRALAEEPGNAEVWYRRSMYLGVLGRTDEHVAAMERAVSLDPLSTRFAVELGLAYLNARRVEDAAAQFRRVMERDSGPEARRARAYWARCLALQGRLQEALAALKGAGDEVFEKEELAYVLAKAGQASAARRLIGSLSAPKSRGLASPLAIAAAQVGMGDGEAAFTTLFHACSEHEPRIVWLQVDQRFDPIRRDPRYLALLDSMGIHPEKV